MRVAPVSPEVTPLLGALQAIKVQGRLARRFAAPRLDVALLVQSQLFAEEQILRRELGT